MSPEHDRLLRDFGADERQAEQARQDARDAFENQCRVFGPQMLHQQELMAAQADVQAARQARAERERREQRAAAEQDYRAQLIVAGRRPRTVGEILADAALFT